MIISRAPMFINLIGDASYSEDAISAAIDKYIYTVINPTPLVNHVSARYSITESAPNTKKLKNERIRETLLKFGIDTNIEIGSFASFPLEMGFRSHLSFTSALVSGLHSNRGDIVENIDLAKEVFEIEKKAKGKNLTVQGTHCASAGGINIYRFGAGNSYEIKPLFVDFHEKLELENLINVFYIKPKAILKRAVRKSKYKDKALTISTRIMVNQFAKALTNGNFEECAFTLHKSWMLEKTIGINIPPDPVNAVYEGAIALGALGGKYIGDPSGGCLLVLGDAEILKKSEKILASDIKIAYTRFQIGFVQSGARTIFKLKQ